MILLFQNMYDQMLLKIIRKRNIVIIELDQI